MSRDTRAISWVKAARKDFEKFPQGARTDIETALTLAAEGRMAEIAKPMKGLGAGVFEVALRYRSDAHRVVYAVRIDADIWVIHAFQKKSKTGIKNAEAGARFDPAKAQTPTGGIEMTKEDDGFDIVRGTGNVFRDLGEPDADVKQAKAILAARIIGILDDRKLTTRQAGEIAGIDHSEFVRIRNANLSRFTIDRLMRIANQLDPELRFALVDAPEPTAPRRTQRRRAPSRPRAHTGAGQKAGRG